jgi:L-amino acid N-acyltransferase YncA
MLAVIIKGNPKFINTPLAKSYYSDIETFLKSLGYTVEFNAGKDYTRPRQDADLYIGHSRGADRYDFMDAKNKSKFLKFGVLEGYIHPVDAAWQKVTKPGTGVPPNEHFIFTDEQKEAIRSKTAELSTESNSTVDTLIANAMKEKFLGPASLNKHMENLVVIESNGKPVGFYIPFQEKDGVWRTGSIYLLPEYRGRGIAKDVIAKFAKERRVRAWIERGNTASVRAFTAAGLAGTGRRLLVNGKHFDEYVTLEESLERNTRILSWD